VDNNRLLLVEDDYDVSEMLLLYFQSQQYEVYHADNGTDGIEIARTRFPNLILLDVMLPDMEGYDVCVRLREMSLTKYIPILFLTQRDERASKVRGLELGADDYITKPFDIDELRLRVQGAIRRATREDLHETRTGLPTGPLVDEEVAQRQLAGEPYTQIHYTLEHFDAFNEVYGFVAGNQVLSYAGRVIQSVLSQNGTSDDFVGIVNDSFLVLTHAANADHIDRLITQRFTQDVRAFYTFTDVERGGVIVNAGTDTAYTAPLMTLNRQRRPLEPSG
jgi:DNA-binding response OmpR family regulator